jgi:hypothetical protein
MKIRPGGVPRRSRARRSGPAGGTQLAAHRRGSSGLYAERRLPSRAWRPVSSRLPAWDRGWRSVDAGGRERKDDGAGERGHPARAQEGERATEGRGWRVAVCRGGHRCVGWSVSGLIRCFAARRTRSRRRGTRVRLRWSSSGSRRGASGASFRRLRTVRRGRFLVTRRGHGGRRARRRASAAARRRGCRRRAGRRAVGGGAGRHR